MRYRWKIDATCRFVGRVRRNGVAKNKSAAECAVAKRLGAMGNRITRYLSTIQPA